MSCVGGGSMLVGRDAELRFLTTRIEGLTAGEPFALVVRGETGSGRSSVLRECRRIGTELGVRVLAARGVRDMVEPAWEALSSLLRPLSGDLDELAGDYAVAMRGVLHERRSDLVVTVQRGLLLTLTNAAAAQPTILCLDDIDAMDAPSLDALAFVFGRLGVDALGTVAVTEPGPSAFDAVATDTLPLSALSSGALIRVIQHITPCADSVARTVASWAGGSPLVAVELARSLTEDERDATTPLPPAPRPTALIVDRLQAELDSLDDEVQRALVVIAADATGRVGPIARALVALGEDPTALDRAEATGTVTIAGDSIRFRQELLRPLAYRLVAAASRRRAHRALAAGLVEPDQAAERVRHLVASCAGPDVEVAAAVALVAASAHRSGDVRMAAESWEQAGRLAADPEVGNDYVSLAAITRLDAFDLDDAIRLADELIERSHPDAALLLTEAVERRDGPDAARRVAPNDPILVADLELSAGDLVAARSLLGDALNGAMDDELVAAILAALDGRADLPDPPERGTVRGRRAYRRWLMIAARRGVAPTAPSTFDEFVAAAVVADGAGRHSAARAFLDQAGGLLPLTSACKRIAGELDELCRIVDAHAAADTGPLSALSSAEHRVAEVVASGLTNRQAADRLYLSIKTVDFHLQSIYRKLAIRSRAELATLIANEQDRGPT